MKFCPRGCFVYIFHEWTWGAKFSPITGRLLNCFRPRDIHAFWQPINVEHEVLQQRNIFTANCHRLFSSWALSVWITIYRLQRTHGHYFKGLFPFTRVNEGFNIVFSVCIEFFVCNTDNMTMLFILQTQSVERSTHCHRMGLLRNFRLT